MRAAQVVALDGPDGVRVGEIGPAPVAGEDEVLIEVHSVGLSYPDLLMSEGRYQIKPEVPFVLGRRLRRGGFPGRVQRSGSCR